MPLGRAGKIERNKQIANQLWVKKQRGPLTVNQRSELRITIRAIRINKRALASETQIHNWLTSAFNKSKWENRILGIPGYFHRDYKRD